MIFLNCYVASTNNIRENWELYLTLRNGVTYTGSLRTSTVSAGRQTLCFIMEILN